VFHFEPDIIELKIQEQRNIITTLPLSYKDVHISIGNSLEVYEHKKLLEEIIGMVDRGK